MRAVADALSPAARAARRSPGPGRRTAHPSRSATRYGPSKVLDNACAAGTSPGSSGRRRTAPAAVAARSAAIAVEASPVGQKRIAGRRIPRRGCSDLPVAPSRAVRHRVCSRLGIRREKRVSGLFLHLWVDLGRGCHVAALVGAGMACAFALLAVRHGNASHIHRRKPRTPGRTWRRLLVRRIAGIPLQPRGTRKANIRVESFIRIHNKHQMK
jgi:hypothetical protein